MLTYLCVSHRFIALFGNRMYSWNDENGEEIELEEPRFYVIYNFLSHCGFSRLFRKTRYGEYHSSLRKINYDLKNNLDIVSILRRLKFHGFAISYLTKDVNARKTLKTLSKNKPVKYIDMNMLRFSYKNIDGLTTGEKMRF